MRRRGVGEVEIVAQEPCVFDVTHSDRCHGGIHGDADVRFLGLAFQVCAAQLPKLPHIDLVPYLIAPGREVCVGVGDINDFARDFMLAGAEVTDILHLMKVVAVQP